MKPQLLIEKFSSLGSLIAALSCAVCFPMLGVVGAIIGISFLQKYEGTLFPVFKILVAVSFLGNIISYTNHKKIVPLVIGTLSPVAILASIYIYWNNIIVYTGIMGLIMASALNSYEQRKCDKKCAVNQKKI